MLFAAVLLVLMFKVLMPPLLWQKLESTSEKQKFRESNDETVCIYGRIWEVEILYISVLGYLTLTVKLIQVLF